MSATEPATLAISLSRLLSRLESTLGDEKTLSSMNEIELNRAAAVFPPLHQANPRMLIMRGSWYSNLSGQKDLENPTRSSFTYSYPDTRNAISQQRKRVLQIHTLITQTQLERSNLPESEEEEDDPKDSINATTTTIANEPTSVLRNRLFGDGREVQQQDLSTEHVLSHHRMLQDDIAESMVGMARNLKDRSVAFGEALREDSKVSA